MRFNSDGKFKIMQITDIQEIPKVSPDTLKLINAALESEKPDLAVFTGDQIKGYGVSYKGRGDELTENVAETVRTLLKPVTDRHIPFAVTFGNHDRQVGISNEEQFEKIYKALPGCIGEFEALKEKGDVLGVYVGHDHKNSYVGKTEDIDVGFTPSAGFNVHGNGKQRGVRCFVLDEKIRAITKPI